MSPGSDGGHFLSYFSGGGHPLVPLLIFADQSQFGTTVLQEAQRLPIYGTESARLCGSLEEAQTIVEKAADPSFRQHLHPNRYWDEQPWWVGWFLEANPDSWGTFIEHYRSTNQRVSTPPHHFVFLPHPATPEALSRLESVLADDNTWVIHVGRKHKSEWQEEISSRSAYLWLQQGWLRFCSVGHSGQVGSSLGIPPNDKSGRLHLVSSAITPDWHHHIPRLAKRTSEDLRDQILMHGASSGVERVTGLTELIDQLLPDHGYARSSDRPEAVEIRAGNNEASPLFLTERGPSPAVDTQSERGTIIGLLTGLREFSFYVDHFLFPNVNRVIESKLPPLTELLKLRTCQRMELPEKQSGLMDDLKSRIRELIDHLNDYLGVRAINRLEAEPFPAGFERAQARARSIPSVPSLLLRVVLLISPVIYLSVEGIRQGWFASNSDYWPVLFCGAGYALLVIGSGVIWLWYSRLRTIRSIESCHESTERRHIQRVAERVSQKIQECMRHALEQLYKWQEQVDVLTQELKGHDFSRDVEVPDNKSPIFNEARVDNAVRDLWDEVHQLSYNRFKENIVLPEWPAWEKSRWFESIQTGSSQALRESISVKDFDYWMSRIPLSHDEKTVLLQGIIASAREHAPTGTTIVIGPNAEDEWSSLKGRYDETEFVDMRTRELVAVHIFEGDKEHDL
jgi:hypothetical protein